MKNKKKKKCSEKGRSLHWPNLIAETGKSEQKLRKSRKFNIDSISLSGKPERDPLLQRLQLQNPDPYSN